MNRPNKITVPNYVDTGQAIYIKWDAVDGATGYKLERAVDKDFFSVVYTGLNTDYIDIALDGWNEVKYRVCALNDAETSEYISSTKVLCAYFKIDANGKLQPFNLIINFKESSIDVLPNIRESSEIISGEDGVISLDIISIHAPRGGERRLKKMGDKEMAKFQSTLPAGGSDNFLSLICFSMYRFQSTLPAGGSDQNQS